MRTAILLVGHIRTWPQCKNNFIESFRHLNPDVFVSTYDLQYDYHPAQQRWMGGKEDVVLSETHIQNFFNHVNLIELDIENSQKTINEFHIVKEKLHLNFQNEMSTYLQYRKIDRGVELIRNIENKKQCKYDIIIKTRPDLQHNKFLYEITQQNAIISTGNVYPNDWIIATSRDNFLKMNDFFKSEFYNPIYKDSHLKTPHNLLSNSFEYAKIAVYEKNLIECIVRRIGNQYYDKTGAIN